MKSIKQIALAGLGPIIVVLLYLILEFLYFVLKQLSKVYNILRLKLQTPTENVLDNEIKITRDEYNNLIGL